VGSFGLVESIIISMGCIPKPELGNEQMSRSFGTGKAVKADYFETESAFTGSQALAWEFLFDKKCFYLIRLHSQTVAWERAKNIIISAGSISKNEFGNEPPGPQLV